MQAAKGQIASLDLIISVAVLLLFIAVVIILFPSGKAESKLEYGSRVFTNIESLDGSMAFLSSYKVDEVKLTAFASLPALQAETLLLNNTEYNTYTSDACVFFMTGSGNVPIGAKPALGEVYANQAHTLRQDCAISSPCSHYDKIGVYVKPVVRHNMIMNMYVIVCSA